MIRILLATLVSLALTLPARAGVDIQEVKTPGGLTAWLVEEHSIPFTALEIWFRGGTSLDRPGKRGAVNLMTATLEEGAGEMDALAFTRAKEELAASFSYDAGDDTVSVSAKFLTENRDEAVALLRETLVSPRFDQEAIDRVRSQVLSIIRSDAKDPNDIAGRAFESRAFGDHPYGTDSNGTVDSVSSLTRGDILQAHADAMARDRIYIGAVGDITPEELATLLDDLLGDLPETGAPLPRDIEPALTGGTTVVPFDTPQSVALFGHAGVDRESDDFFAAYLLNTILGGGGFESRLMTEVREKRGLTYGVYSFLVDKDHADLWMGQVQSANNRVADAIEVIRAQWAEISENGVTAEELEAAKKYLTGAYPLRFDGNGRIANIITGMQIEGMPLDYPATRNDRVEAVTLDQVNDVARRYLDPDALRFVVVGQPEGLSSTD
ncbi:peptidase, M16 family protein [Pseudooceanicola batsensis HTCC2597]|uniref:Peptidase, M16 family protein n=1 Tax=Pseudooceanicola batsensis (strain ATCC BAA-863 / DSM 15984 / KCTC 12145 / HTCC2597) TaxID=252305 RepID=A3TW18_PSEBH|nr:pitrilysin family protein [Pseudooceanicola batsensis]EAQ03814.1 peptidase, M16 family protein [Pseudooceanicola batsensis HTCC2597]